MISLLMIGLVIVTSAQSGGVKGKIRNTQGDSIAGAEITARQNSNDIRTVRSNKKGEFTLNGLEPGTYNFVFEAQGYSSGIRYNIEIKRDKTTDLGDRLVLLVDKGTLVIVQGSVFFKDGRSLSGAKVEVEKVNSDGTTKSLSTFVTNIRGEFVFRQPEGATKFRLTARYKDTSTTKEIEVDTAAVYRVAFTLDVLREN